MDWHDTLASPRPRLFCRGSRPSHLSGLWHKGQQRELAGAGPLGGRGRVRCQQEADGGVPKMGLKRESQALEPQQDPPPSPMRPGTSGIVFMHFIHLRNGDSFHTCPASGTDVRVE